MDGFQAFSQSQLIQVVTQERGLGTSFARSRATARSPAKQCAGDGLHVSRDISRLPAEHMPDGHQQLAGDGNNRLVFADAPTKSLKYPFPLGMVFDGHPGSFHHDRAQFTAALLGNPPTALHLPRGMNTSSQTRIAH